MLECDSWCRLHIHKLQPKICLVDLREASLIKLTPGEFCSSTLQHRSVQVTRAQPAHDGSLLIPSISQISETSILLHCCSITRQYSDSYNPSLNQLEVVWDFSRFLKEVDCTAHWVVINESVKVPVSANRLCRHWTTYVTMYQLQSPHWAYSSESCKRFPSHFSTIQASQNNNWTRFGSQIPVASFP